MIPSGKRLNPGNSDFLLYLVNLRGKEYNAYGCIVTKMKKGCSYFYSMLNTHAKRDGWVNFSIKLESERYNECINWECDEIEILAIVKQVYRTPYLNSLKQSFLRLLRNNLYIGKKNNDANGLDPYSCISCRKHPEKRMHILFSCEVVKELTNQLVSTLREAGLLGKGNCIGII